MKDIELKDIEVVKIPPNFPLFIWDQCSSAIHPIRAATNSKYEVARRNNSEFCIVENQWALDNIILCSLQTHLSVSYNSNP